MKISPFPQYSPEWWEARRGLPTCSEFHRIMTPKTEKMSEGANSYIRYLISQKMRPTPEFFTERAKTRDMEHGAMMEEEARNWYAMDRGAEVQQVGFCISDCGRFGGSPDGLIGDGVLELKCPRVETHVGYMLEGTLPDQYKPQVHGHLIVSGRPWCDFVSYVGTDIDPVIIRVVPDDYTRRLRVALEQFLERYEKTVKRLMDRTKQEQ